METPTERFTWDQATGTEPTIAHLLSLLRDVYTVMQEQRDDNGETIALANPALFHEVGEFYGYVDACAFASGSVTFHPAKESATR